MEQSNSHTLFFVLYVHVGGLVTMDVSMHSSLWGGNGRVACLISSLPQLKLFLPPVVVLKEKKYKYCNCLDAADRKVSERYS
jgi:hypothetical protein